MAYIDTVKEWFKTGLKPTQAQFWAKFAYLRWKDEKIPVEDIQEIEEILNAKADKEAFDVHLTDAAAHVSLFANKEDKANKGTSNGYAPLNEFTKIAYQYLNIVNDLITGGETSLLSAEQGKVLQTQINGINTILQSDDIDLDTVQELVDAIKEVETSLETILVNDLTTGGVTKALTAEMGKVLAERVSVLEVKPIADDFYIAGLLESSKLLYHTDIFREIDLQPYVGITIINTNEIVRNGNDIFVVGNYSFDNTLTPFIVSLINCRTRNNVLIFDSSNFATLSLPIHGLIFHNGFLFSATRTTTTNINKINPYDFTDIRSLSLPNDATYGGQTTDILGYKNKLYVLVTTDFYQTSKFIEISDNLVDYRVVFTIPYSSSYRNGQTSPFLIFNDEVYIPFIVPGDFIAIRVYDLQGNIRRERTNIPILSTVSGGTSAVPHWMGIFNNKILITHTYRKSLVRLDCTTLASEETIALPTSVTDDNTITKDGYILLNGEENPWDLTAPVQLIKVKYNNFSDYTILLQGVTFNNGKGSPGSINNKINVSALNLSAKKDNVLTKTSDYTIVMSDFANNNIIIVYANATAANFIITLPLAAATVGYKIKVIKTDNSANTVTVKGNGSQLINGINTFVLSTQFSTVEIHSNGTQNYIL